MSEPERCQSCAVLLSQDNYGTGIDGKLTHVFCKMCFEEGAFVDPNMSINQMMEKSVKFIAGQQNISEEEARKIAKSVVPRLDRWVL